MKTILAIQLALILSWGVNLYKLTQCNFEPSYKAEVIRAIGVFTPISIVTAWMDIEDKQLELKP